MANRSLFSKPFNPSDEDEFGEDVVDYVTVTDCRETPDIALSVQQLSASEPFNPTDEDRFGEDAGDCVMKDCRETEDIALSLKELSASEYKVFISLLIMFHSATGNVKIAIRKALMQMPMNGSTVKRIIALIKQGSDSKLFRSKIDDMLFNEIILLLVEHSLITYQDVEFFTVGKCRIDKPVYFLSSLLDVLLLKKNLSKRNFFEVFLKLTSENLVHETHLEGGSDQLSPRQLETQNHIVLTLFTLLEEIILSPDRSEEVGSKSEIRCIMTWMIDYAKTNKDTHSVNDVLSLFSAIIRGVLPKIVSKNILTNILGVVGELASKSDPVLVDLISAIVLCWLSKDCNLTELLDELENVCFSKAPNKKILLRAFIAAFPEIEENNRHLIFLRCLNMTETPVLLIMLFSSLVSRKTTDFLNTEMPDTLKFINEEWEYKLAVKAKISGQTWFQLLSYISKKTGNGNVEQSEFFLMFLAMKLFLQNLENLSEEDMDAIQSTPGKLTELMEHVVFLLHLVDARKRELNFPDITMKTLKETMHTFVKKITPFMIPYVYFRSIFKLLGHSNENVRREALIVLSAAAEGHGEIFTVLRGCRKSFANVSTAILEVLTNSSSSSSLKTEAISVLKLFADKGFNFNKDMISKYMTSIAECNKSNDLALVPICLETLTALIKTFGRRTLAILDRIMDQVFKFARIVLSKDLSTSSGPRKYVLSFLREVLRILGQDLNHTQIELIMDLLVLYPEYVSGVDAVVEFEARELRSLLLSTIPVQLALLSLWKLFPAAVKAGSKSSTILSDLLLKFIGERVSLDCKEIFPFCLDALDLRRCHLSICSIDTVEEVVINCISKLTLKLSSSDFEWIISESIKWADSAVDGTDASAGNIDRAISFYGMVNKLADDNRTLFVQCFKLTVMSCVRVLNGKVPSFAPMQKKAKLLDGADVKETNSLSFKDWHLRKLVMSYLLKFLPHTADLTVSKELMPPIVSQLDLDPPASLDNNSMDEFDLLIVNCISLLKLDFDNLNSLNNKVLAMIRGKKMRDRILGLKIAHSLADNLKKEHLLHLLSQPVEELIGKLVGKSGNHDREVRVLANQILRKIKVLKWW